jgi:hypothetical protein
MIPASDHAQQIRHRRYVDIPTNWRPLVAARFGERGSTQPFLCALLRATAGSAVLS